MISGVYSMIPAMGKIVADSGVAYCLMHNRDKITEEMDADLFYRADERRCKKGTGRRHQERADYFGSGVGFAKTQEQNLMTIANLDRLKALGYPVLLGTSRKSVIGYVLDADRQASGGNSGDKCRSRTDRLYVRACA